MTTAIRFDHVSKRFTLQMERPRSFQELFLNLIHLKGSRPKQEYWALQDVDFEIQPGQTVGIIGDNGAGKSTLLKLISRIIEPSSGQITVHGRVSALLELGAGFHPDLTGRENIYLNGSILGFNKAQMDQILDDIVDFSEMERFIDAPVKHYSSGMYMRLGFSIAIHVRPDILLVDEVLAVGDQAFQLRCLDKINEMKRRGITIILVTHDLNSVRSLCDRVIWLEDGCKEADGPIDRVLEQYMLQVLASDQHALQRAEAGRKRSNGSGPPGSGAGTDQGSQRGESAWRWGSREAEVVRVQFLDGEGRERRSFRTGDTLIARIHYVAHERIKEPLFGVALHHADGFQICGPNTQLSDYPVEAIEGEGYIDFIIANLSLLHGTFLFSAALYDAKGQHAFDHHHMAYTLRVSPGKEIREKYGSIYIPSRWQLGTPVALQDTAPDRDDGQ